VSRTAAPKANSTAAEGEGISGSRAGVFDPAAFIEQRFVHSSKSNPTGDLV
jgi:hypothetical protein